MRNVLGSIDEVCHVFARQSQDYGKSGSVYFEKNIIYSYGSHFPIAKIINNDTVIFTSRKYSSTTATHKSTVQRALSHFRFIYVPHIDSNLKINIEERTHDINTLLEKASVAVKNAPLYIADAREMYEHLIEFKALTKQKGCTRELRKLDKMTDHPDLSIIKEQVKKEKAKTLKLKKEREAAIEKENAEKIAAWVSGVSNNRPYNIRTVYLRISDDEVQTTMGARVSVAAAKLLWSRIKAGKPVKGHDIDGYTVISLNGTLKIGCHDIQRSEVDRIGALLDQI